MSGECDDCGEHCMDCRCDYEKPISTTVISAEMCECGRLYKDRRDENGKMMCSCCATGLSVDQSRILWNTPIPPFISECFQRSANRGKR